MGGNSISIAHIPQRVIAISQRIADIFKAEVVDTGLAHFVFEVKGRKEQIDRFIELMVPLGLTEICRSGVIAVSRGDKAL